MMNTTGDIWCFVCIRAEKEFTPIVSCLSIKESILMKSYILEDHQICLVISNRFCNMCGFYDDQCI